MNRDPGRLSDQEFDVLVIGGGMFGACTAWSAILRGYSVALVEKNDFSHATSSNHYKFIHGGIRYLQHADIVRMRESSRERSALVRVAPHLAYPMPVVLPTYGHGRKGRLIMRAGMTAYDILTLDRNRGIADRRRRTPNGSFFSRDEVIHRFPGVSREGLTGAAVFHDGQMYNPARLVLSFLKSAAARGAVVANYVEANELIQDGYRITGCTATDLLAQKPLEIRARMVINAAGPWASEVMLKGCNLELQPKPSFSRDLAFVVNRSICPTHALGCQATTGDSDALLDRGGRHLFLVPWRGKTLVGVWHRYSEANPDRISVSQEELGSFLSEINSAYDGLHLQIDDIETVNTGLILFGSADDQKSIDDHSFAKRSLVVDHAQQGLDGLITVVGARATVARGVGDKILDIIDSKTSRRGPVASSAWQKIYGGEFDGFEALANEIRNQLPKVSHETARAVAHNYGSAYEEMLSYGRADNWLEAIAGTNVLKAEVAHAVQNEMAASLADVVFRRTELGTGGNPGEEALEFSADVAGKLLNWDSRTRHSEIESVRTVLDNRGPWNFVARTDELPAGE